MGKRNSKRRGSKTAQVNKRKQVGGSLFSYDKLELRQLLAALFPTYIDGNFTLGNGTGASTPYDLADTFKLESNPSATKTIYLDFDGHHSVNNRWNHDIVFPAFNRTGSASTFADSELIEIQAQFQNVAEDFLAFDVNVTTKEPNLGRLIKSGSNDQYYGIRSLNTQATDGFGNGIGGVAYLNSFDDGRDNPVFTFNKGANNGALTNSHEIGHALGLSHDGLGGSSYHPGTGSGETGWGPIMGAPFGKNLTQWSNGDYANSTQTQNDYNIMTKSANGFGFRVDDNGDTFSEATSLSPDATGAVFEWGIVERRSDVDMFSFQTGGNITLSIDAMADRPDLDVLAKIYDASGNLVASSNPVNKVDADFDLSVAPGQYYLSVEGIGKTDVYSDYGSIGFYSIDGTLDVVDTVIGETGRISVSSRWKTVSLDHTYTDPVVIAGPGSRKGGHQMNVRIRNVTSDSFQIQIDDWNYLDGRHRPETVAYMVVEAGEHTLTDGTVLVAGNQSGQTHLWADYDLGTAFDGVGRPVVFSQLVTKRDYDAATTRMRFTSDSTFEIQIQDEEAAKPGHRQEKVSYIAVQQAVGTTGGLNFEAAVTSNSVTHKMFNLNFTPTFADAPAFFADMQTRDGRDTATVRYQRLDSESARIFLEEEKSKDAELNHTTEVVGFFAVELGDIVAGGGGSSAPFAVTMFEFSDHSKALAEQQSWGETSLSVTDDVLDGHEESPRLIFASRTAFDFSMERVTETRNRVHQVVDRIFELAGSVELKINAENGLDSLFDSDITESDRLELVYDMLRQEFDRFA